MTAIKEQIEHDELCQNCRKRPVDETARAYKMCKECFNRDVERGENEKNLPDDRRRKWGARR